MTLSSLLILKRKHNWSELKSIWKELVDGTDEKKSVFQKETRLVVSKDTWPKRKAFSLNDIFDGDIKIWNKNAEEQAGAELCQAQNSLG